MRDFAVVVSANCDALEEGGCLGSWAICAILRDFVIVGLQTEVLELLRVSGDCAIHEPDPRTIHLDSSKHVYTVLRTPSVPFKYLPSQRHDLLVTIAERGTPRRRAKFQRGNEVQLREGNLNLGPRS